MNQEIKWQVLMVAPGEEELSLLAELSNRQDTHVVGLVDPTGDSLGAGLAEVMGLPVFASLSQAPPDQARFLIHPPLCAEVEDIIAEAADQGLTPVSAGNFNNLLVDHALTSLRPQLPVSSRSHFDFLENETATIHQTLGRIEEALDREALLRWLLKLATKATGASSGSIMLFDTATQELYVAFAHGLSQNTLHQTRVRPGQGISGRVARTRQAEIIRGDQHGGKARDRGALLSALSAPIVWQDQVLGVINVSCSDGERDLKGDALGIIENLSGRFGLILDRFLRLQTVRDGDTFRKLEESLTTAEDVLEPGGNTLSLWAENLMSITRADGLSIGLLTTGGDLLVADPEGVDYENPPAPEKDAVLASGSPLVLRPAANGFPENDAATIFHLPIGRGPCKALLTVEFKTASRAHHFHTLSAEVIYLVHRHLGTWLDRMESTDQVDRLTILAGTLTEMSTLEPGQADRLADRAVASACQLTGAKKACILGDERDRDGSPDDPLGPEMRGEAIRLLLETDTRGWRSSILEGQGEGHSIMVVPLRPGQPFPGLVLMDKERLHPLDGASFTEFDALFARRLLPVFHAQANRTTPATLKETPAPAVEFFPATPEPDSPPAGEETVLPPAPMAPDIRRTLTIEIDRCKRYHNTVGVLGVRYSPVTGPVPDPAILVAELGKYLRTSDQAGFLDDGTLLVVVPEDIQSLAALQTRMVTLLRSISGQDDLQVQGAHRVFPGTGNSAQELLEALLASLE